jgi:hypothetical protein
MTTRLSLRVLAPALLLLLLVAAQSLSAATGTIILNSGEKFESVDYTVVREYKVVQFASGNDKHAVSFSDIASIVDKSGQDVTVSVLGGDYRRNVESAVASTPQAEWLRSKDSTYIRYNAKPFSVGFGAWGTYTIPATDYYEGITPKMGFGMHVVVPFSRHFSVRGQFSKAGHGIDLAKFYQGTGFAPLQSTLKLSTLRFFLAGQYQTPLGRKGFAQGSFYFYSGLGVTTHSFSGSTIARDVFQTPDVYELTHKGETRFTWTIGLGVVSMLSRSLGIEFGTNFDNLIVGTTTDSNGYGTVQSAANFDIKLGLFLISSHATAKHDTK